MRRGAALAIATAALGLAPAAAAAATQTVSVQFAAFAPTPLDVLPGETVEWDNTSDRRHTVTADDGSFDSGDLLGGDRFSRNFDATGAIAYHCTVHPGMTGEIDVRQVTLGLLPATAVVAGSPVEFEGRTATSAEPVTIEARTSGAFRAIGQATPAADGTWTARLRVRHSGEYRAVTAAGASETRRLLVSDRTVHVRATARGVAVTVTPPAPYGQVQLQERQRERFGWWSLQRAVLDYVSQAEFAVRGPARVRVVLVDRDAWTPIATSRVLRLGR